LQELISNCVKHAFPAGTPGEISITLHSDLLQQACLIVRDTGIGLPETIDSWFAHF
jgi:two-component sensor histidine kinase